jgi:hypothetical protein
MREMRENICGKIRSGVKYSSSDENRTMIDKCLKKIGRYQSGTSGRRGVKRVSGAVESDSE